MVSTILRPADEVIVKALSGQQHAVTDVSLGDLDSTGKQLARLFVKLVGGAESAAGGLDGNLCARGPVSKDEVQQP